VSSEKIQAELANNIASLSGLELEVVIKALTKPSQREHGDIAFPCFLLAKSWKLSPPECAKKLTLELKLPDGISEATPTGPYINFKFDRKQIIESIVPKILQEQHCFARKKLNNKNLIVEYSSPNIAKTFHVGHLRTTLIGHSLAQIYKHLGYNVISINHLGDWGTQFGFVWAGCKLWDVPNNANVDDLVELYRKASNLRKAQDEGKVASQDAGKPDVNQMARDYFIKLEAADPEATKFWQWCLDISMDYFKAMYDRLGIKFDHYTGESFFRDQLATVEQKIRDSGVLEESRGALGVDCGKKLGFARVFTEDGRSLYITRDIATAIYREETFHPEKILYVVANQQSLHFAQLIDILHKMRHPVAEKMAHVAFGFVPGMKTREGGGISLKEFINEAKERALEAYKTEVQKRPEGTDENLIAEAVAIGSTYFYFLSNSNIKDFQFSWTEALNFQGDSGPYLQYAFARLNSIEANAKKAGIDTSLFDASLLKEESAYELALLLTEFAKVVEKAGIDYEPYYIAHYLVDLAKAFSRSYRDLFVVSENVANPLASSRLALFMAVKHVLGSGLKLLGVPLVEKM